MTTTRYLSVVAILCGLLGCAPVAAAPIMTGRQVIDINGAPMEVFTYRPPGCSDPSLLMVFHGVARNARTYRDDARAIADRLCLLVVAPVFDKRAFPAWRYQRGGIVKDTVVQDARDWTGRLVLDLVAWVRAQEGRPLAYSLLAFLAVWLSRRILWFGPGLQALHVALILVVVQCVVLLVRLAAGNAFPGWPIFVGPLAGALLWPAVTWLLLLPQRRTEREQAI